MSQPGVLPRTKSSFSLGSRSSRKSSLKAPSTPDKDKMNVRIQGKADPTKAIHEEEPFAVSQMGNTSIRTLQHKDLYGNVIEPDRSNPTRSRWERPLDTIRSFEAAVDSHHKRQSYARPEIAESSQARQSFYSAPYASSRMSSQVDFHRGRPGMSRPDRYVGGTADRGSSASWMHDSPHNHPYNPYRNRSNGRMNSEPVLNGHASSSRPSPPPHQDQYGSSYDGSLSTDAWGNSTNPSSDNGSFDRAGDYWGNNYNRPGKNEGRYDGSPSRPAPDGYSNGPIAEYRNQYDEITPIGPAFKGKHPGQGGSPGGSQGHWGGNGSPSESRIDPWAHQNQHQNQPQYQNSQHLHPPPNQHPQQRQLPSVPAPLPPPPPPQHQHQAPEQYGIDFAPVQNYALAQNALPPLPPSKDVPKTLSKRPLPGLPARPAPPEKRKSWFKRLSSRD